MAARDDAAWLAHPDWWQTWPICPLKRNPDIHKNDHEGVVLESDPTKVYHMNMFLPRDNVKTTQYASIADLLKDGWMVD